MSSNGNDLAGTNGINSIGSRNKAFVTGWVGGFSPTQYGSSVSHSYHHHSPIGTIAGINGASGNDEIPTGWGSATEIGLYYTEIANNSLLFFARDNILNVALDDRSNSW
ncbi:MAG: hypothetical protein WBF33_33880 [Candidatus Nitrosopolaris sp.]